MSRLAYGPAVPDVSNPVGGMQVWGQVPTPPKGCKLTKSRARTGAKMARDLKGLRIVIESLGGGGLGVEWTMGTEGTGR